jgi:hypothetical protein
MHSHSVIALESLTRNGFALLASTSELEASQTKHTQGQYIPKMLNLSQARALPLFIALSQVAHFYVVTGQQRASTGQGVAVPSGRIAMAI